MRTHDPAGLGYGLEAFILLFSANRRIVVSLAM